MKFAFGCRDPSTNVGSYEEAFVVIGDGKKIVSIMISDQRIYKEFDEKIEDCLKRYDELIDYGWCKMTPMDVSVTADIYIDGETIIDVEMLRCKNKPWMVWTLVILMITFPYMMFYFSS